MVQAGTTKIAQNQYKIKKNIRVVVFLYNSISSRARPRSWLIGEILESLWKTRKINLFQRKT